MRKFVHLLRRKDAVYLIVLICVFISLIVSAMLTDVSQLLGQRLLLVCLSILIYLMVFLGVNPILKGIFLTLIPTGFLIILPMLFELLPSGIYEKWVAVDTSRGKGPASILVFLFIALVVKLSKVKPYILDLAHKKEEEEKRKKKDERNG